MKKPHLIALLTDFGSSDAYVASMKGVLHTKIPGVSFVDISHNVPPQDVQHAGYVLWSTYRYFPAGTIFLPIVDPGVGSRRKICIGKIDGYIFVFPDNGILDFVLQSASRYSFFQVNVPGHFRSASNTFHGRDVFAPVAAHIASGKSIRTIASPVSIKIPQKRFTDITRRSKNKWRGRIIHKDSFGNLITNFMTMKPLKRTTKLILHNKKTISHMYRSYHDARSGTPFMIIGSTGLIEISVKNGNASQHLNVDTNTSVELFS